MDTPESLERALECAGAVNKRLQGWLAAATAAHFPSSTLVPTEQHAARARSLAYIQILGLMRARHSHAYHALPATRGDGTTERILPPHLGVHLHQFVFRFCSCPTPPVQPSSLPPPPYGDKKKKGGLRY